MQFAIDHAHSLLESSTSSQREPVVPRLRGRERRPHRTGSVPVKREAASFRNRAQKRLFWYPSSRELRTLCAAGTSALHQSKLHLLTSARGRKPSACGRYGAEPVLTPPSCPAEPNPFVSLNTSQFHCHLRVSFGKRTVKIAGPRGVCRPTRADSIQDPLVCHFQAPRRGLSQGPDEHFCAASPRRRGRDPLVPSRSESSGGAVVTTPHRLRCAAEMR